MDHYAKLLKSSNHIISTLQNSGLPWNYDTVLLLLETMAVESDFGKYTTQTNGGPAVGIFQMESATAADILDNYVFYRPELKRLLNSHIKPAGKCNWKMLLVNDQTLATIMARIHYMRVPAPIPNNRIGRAAYWKTYYNTRLGKGTVAKYMDKAVRYIGV